MALSLSFFPFNSKQRMLKRAASSRPLYRPELIARVHPAMASSPDAFSHVSTSSAAAGVAANQAVDVKARAASVPRRIDARRMSLGQPFGADYTATARGCHGYLRAASYLLMGWS